MTQSECVWGATNQCFSRISVSLSLLLLSLESINTSRKKREKEKKQVYTFSFKLSPRTSYVMTFFMPFVKVADVEVQVKKQVGNRFPSAGKCRFQIVSIQAQAEPLCTWAHSSVLCDFVSSHTKWEYNDCTTGLLKRTNKWPGQNENQISICEKIIVIKNCYRKNFVPRKTESVRIVLIYGVLIT